MPCCQVCNLYVSVQRDLCSLEAGNGDLVQYGAVRCGTVRYGRVTETVSDVPIREDSTLGEKARWRVVQSQGPRVLERI